MKIKTQDNEHPVYEQVFNVHDDLNRMHLNEVVFALLDYLGLEAVRTNATEHGEFQTLVRRS